jgi:hypothetical protein
MAAMTQWSGAQLVQEPHHHRGTLARTQDGTADQAHRSANATRPAPLVLGWVTAGGGQSDVVLRPSQPRRCRPCRRCSAVSALCWGGRIASGSLGLSVDNVAPPPLTHRLVCRKVESSLARSGTSLAARHSRADSGCLPWSMGCVGVTVLLLLLLLLVLPHPRRGDSQVPDRCSCIQRPGTRSRQLRDGMAVHGQRHLIRTGASGPGAALGSAAWVQVLRPDALSQTWAHRTQL